MNVKAAFEELVCQLEKRYDSREARNIARIVFEDAFGWTIYPDDQPFRESDELSRLTRQLLEGIPWQYVLGHADFYGKQWKVNSAVLIPRPETEELVHWVLQMRGQYRAPRVLDIGSGSGIIAGTLAGKWPEAEVWGMEVSEAALEICGENADRLGWEVKWVQDSILSPQQDWPVFDLIVSNPPYILQSERGRMPEHVLRYEPELALFVEGEDPLLFYKSILAFAQKHLHQSGQVFLEINEFNKGALEVLFRNSGWAAEFRRDMQGKWRMVRGQLKR